VDSGVDLIEGTERIRKSFLALDMRWILVEVVLVLYL
jgi:hypothetical protein